MTVEKGALDRWYEKYQNDAEYLAERLATEFTEVVLNRLHGTWGKASHLTTDVFWYSESKHTLHQFLDDIMPETLESMVKITRALGLRLRLVLDELPTKQDYEEGGHP